MDVHSLWYTRFENIAKILEEFYAFLLKKYSDKRRDFLEFLTLVERAQFFPWAYIDYGFRVPIYRTMQWIHLEYLSDQHWRKLVSETRKVDYVIDLQKHLLKEYTYLWSEILSLMDIESEEVKALNAIMKGVLGFKAEPIEIDRGAFYDLVGLAYELKACYVLIDHDKPFLPFSIMQAPITPSYIKPGAASGDLYLFEENLVVDIKRGWLNRKTRLPTYRYGGNNNLIKDLKRVSGLHYLYGIRKGIGVVAEDSDDYIHLAIYVPWRRWRTDYPLLYLKSAKLPLLLYMHRVGERGIKQHRISESNSGKFAIDVEIYALKEIDVKELSMRMRILNREQKRDIEIGDPKITKTASRIFCVEFKVNDNVDDYAFDIDNMKFVLAKLFVKYEDKILEYPIIATLRT